MAHTMRAVLLAKATAASLRGLRPSRFKSHGEAVGRAGLACWMTAVAPSTNSCRSRSSPARLMPPRRCLPAVELLARHQPDPGRKMPRRFELRRVVCGRPCWCKGGEMRKSCRCGCGRVSGLCIAARGRWPRWVPRSTPKRKSDLSGHHPTRVVWIVGPTDQHLFPRALHPPQTSSQAAAGAGR